MHLHELHACFALISSALVCVVVHPFLSARGIFFEICPIHIQWLYCKCRQF